MRKGLKTKAWSFLAGPAILYLVAVLALIIVMGLHLTSHPAALRPPESTAVRQSQSLGAILHNPLYAPHSLLAYGLKTAGLGWTTALRLTSVIWGLVFALSFYYLAKTWFGRIVALLGAAVLATTPLFLLASRAGSDEVMLFATIPLMTLFVWTQRARRLKNPLLALLVIMSGVFIYVPGVIWWLAGSAIVCRRKLAELIDDVPPAVSGTSAAVALALLVPLGWTLSRHLSLLKALLLLPATLPSPLHWLSTAGWMLSALFFRTPYHSALAVGRLPVLNVIQVILLIFGLYAMWSAARAKTIALLAFTLFGILAAATMDQLNLLALSVVPLSIFVAAGLRYLYIEWRGVFPRNPLAKAVAVSLMCAVVAVQLLFGVRYSLQAWPHTVSGQNQHVIK